MDRLIQMIINMVMRRGIDMAMNKGADLIVGRGKTPEEMTPEELEATRLDMACEYDPDRHQPSAIWVGVLAPYQCEAEI